MKTELIYLFIQILCTVNCKQTRMGLKKLFEISAFFSKVASKVTKVLSISNFKKTTFSSISLIRIRYNFITIGLLLLISTN